MNQDSLLFFTPYIGDTILATALANKFSNHFNEEVYVASINQEMCDFANDLGGNGFYYSTLGEMVKEGSQVAIPLVKQYMGGTDFSYSFYRDKEEKRLEKLCLDIVYGVEPTFQKFYILHYSYAYAKLGQIAKKEGFEVWGYCIDDQNRLYFSKGNTDCEVPSLWTKDFIGDRLSNIITGQNLNRQDYADFGESLHRKGVLLFPTTRSIQPNAGNWEVDVKVLASLGYDFNVLWYMYEEQPTFTHSLSFNRYGVFETIREMTDYIKSADFIICYDSASFHLAWLTGTPAIVKLKGGFNEEWIPSWVKSDHKYYFIPSNEMYEEEYLSYLKTGLSQIGW